MFHEYIISLYYKNMQIINPILLKDRSIIKVSGKDNFNFLQSIVTADLNILNSNNSVGSCILTPQGRILFDFMISQNNHDKSFVIDCFAEEVGELIKKLNLYKLRSEVDIYEDKKQKVFICSKDNKKSLIDLRHKDLPSRLLDDSNHDYEEKLAQEYKEFRIKLCVFEGPKEIVRESSLPLDYWMDKTNNISFSKGCFIGQEVNARIFHRNKIKKRVISIKSSEIEDDKIFRENFKFLFHSKNMSVYFVPVDFIENNIFNSKTHDNKFKINIYN